MADENDSSESQPLEDIEKTLFELANSERLSILLKLKVEDGNRNLSKLSKDLNIIVQEVHRHINRLLEAGLIRKDSSSGSFSLTTFGKTLLTQLSALTFLSTNRSYFSDHTLGDLPMKFIQRIGSLENSQYLNNSVAVFERQKELLDRSDGYVHAILPYVPQYLIDSVMPTIERGDKLSYILPYNAVLPKKRHNISKHDEFYQLLGKQAIQRRMIDRVQVAIMMNKNYAMTMFPTSVKGETDMNSAFWSKDTLFYEWCLDYFNDRWKNSKPFNPAKLKEV